MRGRPFTINRLLRRSLFGAAALTVASASPAAAQWDFGIFAGPTNADFTGSYVESSVGTWGFTLGVFVERRFSRHFSLEAGVSMLGQAGSFKVKSLGRDSIWDYRTGYLQVPIAVNYLLPIADDKWELRGFAGFSPAFGGSCEIKPSNQFSFDTDCGGAGLPGGDFEKFDLLLQFGVGFDRVFNGGSGFGFDARYSIGTQNVLGEAAANGLSAKNRILDIKFRLFLPLEGPRR